MWLRLAILFSFACCAVSQSPPAQAARKWREQNERAILEEFAVLL